MKRIAAAAATLVLGVTMCTASAQAQERERYTTALRPIAAPSIAARNERGAPWQNSRASDRGIARSQRERINDRERDRAYENDRVYENDRRDDPSWGETAMIVGGSAATGAGIGGLIGGGKGAMIGAAIGGGGAAIYEGTRRR